MIVYSQLCGELSKLGSTNYRLRAMGRSSNLWPARHQEILRDREIVLFLTWPNEASSARAALILRNYGITHVHPLQVGADPWRQIMEARQAY